MRDELPLLFVCTSIRAFHFLLSSVDTVKYALGSIVLKFTTQFYLSRRSQKVFKYPLAPPLHHPLHTYKLSICILSLAVLPLSPVPSKAFLFPLFSKFLSAVVTLPLEGVYPPHPPTATATPTVFVNLSDSSSRKWAE